MSYGIDVAKYRLDDLDKIILENISRKLKSCQSPKVLILGSGAGGVALSLAKLNSNIKVQAIDILPYSNNFLHYQNQDSILTQKLKFTQADMLEFVTNMETGCYTDVVIQRSLHYLPYDSAVKLLKLLSEKIIGHLYLSVSGVNTAIATHYPNLKQPLNKRFFKLNEAGRKKFSISQPLCLYSLQDIMKVTTACGWRICYHKTSAFGNIKLVAGVD